MATVPVKLLATSFASAVFLMSLTDDIGAGLTALAASMPVAAAIADKNSEKTIDHLGALISSLTASGLSGAEEISRQATESRTRLLRVRTVLWTLALLVPAAVVLAGLQKGAWIAGVTALVFYRCAVECDRTLRQVIALKEQLERDVVAERNRQQALRRLYSEQPLRPMAGMA